MPDSIRHPVALNVAGFVERHWIPDVRAAHLRNDVFVVMPDPDPASSDFERRGIC
jgi:hypothetical protein